MKKSKTSVFDLDGAPVANVSMGFTLNFVKLCSCYNLEMEARTKLQLQTTVGNYISAIPMIYNDI